MATKPMFDHPQANYEFMAREQMGLGDDWRLKSIAAAVMIGLEDKIDGLEANSDLDDAERWQGLDVSGATLAWLPDGLELITMKRQVEGEVQVKAGFVQTKQGRPDS